MTNEELVMQIQKGINRKDNLAQLYRQNLPLIRKAIAPYLGIYEEDDLMQEAFIGLMDAADRWDEKQGFMFMTYAPWCIKTALYRSYNNDGKEKRIPEYMVQRIRQYRKYVREFEEQTHGMKPGKYSTMGNLGINAGQYDLMIKTIAEAEIISIHKSIGNSDSDDDMTLEDCIADHSTKACEDQVIEACMKDSLWKQVDELPSIESDLIHLKFQDEKTMQEIASLKQISLKAIKNAELRAYNSLRNKTAVRKIADDYGMIIGSRAYKDSFSKYKNTFTSQVEMIAIKNVSRQEAHDEKQKGLQKRANALLDEIMQIG